MTFAVVGSRTEERRKVTDMLLSLYPGGVIYEYSDPQETLLCMREHKLDGVFLELCEEDSQNLCLVGQIREQDLWIPVVVCAEDDFALEEAMWNGASRYFVSPLLPEQIRGALKAG